MHSGKSEHICEIARNQVVGSVLDPVRHGCIGRSAARRVVLEAAIFRRIVRGRDHNAVGKICRSADVKGEDGMGNRRRRRITPAAIDHGFDAICREHFDRARESWLGQRVRVFSDVQRAIDVVAPAVVTNRLRDRQDVRLIE
jgi:hypothetical protein